MFFFVITKYLNWEILSDFQGGSQKTNIQEELPERGGLGQLADLKGAALQKRGAVLRGVDNPMHTVTMNTKHIMFIFTFHKPFKH